MMAGAALWDVSAKVFTEQGQWFGQVPPTPQAWALTAEVSPPA